MEKTVLEKTLRTGQHLVLTYTQTATPNIPTGFTAIVDGTIVSEGFSAPIHRNCVDDPDTPHVIHVPNIIKSPGSAPVSLTPAEADQIEAGKKQVREQVYENPDRQRAQQARSAAPDAPTWRAPYTFTERPQVGSTYQEGHRVVTVLRTQSHWTEDGPSFHLDSETGYYYTATVREATDSEIQGLTEQEAKGGRLAAARRNLGTLFVWDGKADGIDAERATYDDTHPREGATRLHVSYGRELTLADDAIYSTTTPTHTFSPHPYWRHPLTPERAEVFAALAELDPWVQLTQPVPRPVGRPKVGRQITATLPEETIARLDEIAEQEGRKRGQVLRDIVVTAIHRGRLDGAGEGDQ